MVTSTNHPTLEWSSLQNVFYRKSDIYHLTWGIDNLSDYLITSAKNGGLVALIRDPSRLVSLGKAALLKPKIHIYTSAGQLVESIPWLASEKIIGFGFTLQEQLAVVLDDGMIRLYTLLQPCPSPPQSTPASSSSQHEDQRAFRPVEATSTCYYTQHSLGQEATDAGVVDAKMWPGGIVAISGGGRFVEWRFPKRSEEESLGDSEQATQYPQLLPPLDLSLGQSNIPSSWSLIDPDNSSSGLLEILVSASTSDTIVSLDSVSGSTDMKLSRGPFSAIRPSPNGNLLALLTADLKLWVVSSDFQRSLSEFDVTQCDAYRPSTSAPSSSGESGMRNAAIRQIEWCGNNTVAIAWENEILMIGPFGDSLQYLYSGAVHLVSEVDGLRIISPDRLEFIQKVAESSSNVFLPGSSHPSAILFDSSEHFARKSAKADEGIRAIKKDLAMAVDTCIAAAGYEWDVGWQRRLLRAASFGKAFLENYDPTSLVDMSQTLRILNATRRYEVGVFTTYEQYSLMGPKNLISRLTGRNHHLLSLRISSYLQMRPDSILKHWARGKIARSRPATGALAQAAIGAPGAKIDDEICDAIVKKFEMQPAVSYAEIAKTAWNAGRIRLATKLLDHEPRAVDQVPLLLHMHENKLALIKALESGDTDLVYHVLLQLKSQLSRGDFFRIIQAPIADASAPTSEASNGEVVGVHQSGAAATSSYVYLACNLLENYAREEDRELLKDFYYQDDRRTESALLVLEEAKGKEDLVERITLIKDAHRLFSEDKERNLEAKFTEEYSKLLGFQSALEKEEGGRLAFVGLSVNETIRQCLIKNMPKKAEKVRTDWKVPDKRFWSIKVSALISTRDLESLWSFANAKKSPIGYQPFISQLISAGFLKESLRYVPKCASDKGDRARLRMLIQRLPPQAAQQIAQALGE
ncbi:hypothetical protein CBS101457_001883 [Exobasidium rhododendri]|nr:hypothetical protein CBS101457_001883 [Exobasidium rhododendri]